MSAPAISVRNIKKRFTLGAERNSATTLREALVHNARAVKQTARRLVRRTPSASSRSTHWALRDVSFDVQPGEVVGIIGRNGAGKSTLLKVLSRITEPTSGRIELSGRVGSLLEVGTGFHPELTGRENTYLNGAILGMARSEVDRKFDEIVAFAEVEKFIDTPVKHYSSGMYLRLAFAVAAHLEPEILVVDEVLAVGDMAFQKKCLGKMQDVATQGRTILFVSHNLAAVTHLCTRALVLEGGVVAHDTTPHEAVQAYMGGLAQESQTALGEREDRQGNQHLKFTSLRFLDGNGAPVSSVPAGSDLTLELGFDAQGQTLRNAVLQVSFFDHLGMPLFACLSRTVDEIFPEIRPGQAVRCRLPCVPLTPGLYSLKVICKEDSYTLVDAVDGAAQLEVTLGNFYGNGRMGPSDTGPFLVRHEWSL